MNRVQEQNNRPALRQQRDRITNYIMKSSIGTEDVRKQQQRSERQGEEEGL